MRNYMSVIIVMLYYLVMQLPDVMIYLGTIVYCVLSVLSVLRTPAHSVCLVSVMQNFVGN